MNTNPRGRFIKEKNMFASMVILLDLLMLSYPMGNHKDIFSSHNIPPVHMHKRCIVIFMCLKDLRENKNGYQELALFREIWRYLLVKDVYF